MGAGWGVGLVLLGGEVDRCWCWCLQEGRLLSWVSLSRLFDFFLLSRELVAVRSLMLLLECWIIRPFGMIKLHTPNEDDRSEQLDIECMSEDIAFFGTYSILIVHHLMLHVHV